MLAPIRLALAPLLVAALASALIMISNHLIYIGPIDRATFGWAVPMPMWFLTPAVAAYRWRGAPRADRFAAAVMAGGVVALVTGGLLWGTAVSGSCGRAGTPLAPIWSSAVVAFIVGGAFGGSCRVASGLAADGRNRVALVIGSAVGVFLQLLAFPLAATVFFLLTFGMCQTRP